MKKNSFNAITDDSGEISFEMNVTPGFYTFDCVFSGDNTYKQSSTSQHLYIMKE